MRLEGGAVMSMHIELPQILSGKVRELYDAGDDRLLMVASDRVSAFDVIMAEPIAEKGRVLTAMTVFWCDEMADVVPGTLLAVDPDEIAAALPGVTVPPEWAGRAMLVQRAEMLKLECIVRGYLAGQAFGEYEKSGTVHGTRMPAGLKMADRLAEPMFTPSTKAEAGHDINIDFAAAVDLVGAETAAAARDICLELYNRAAARAADVGFILADTKFELGYVDGTLSLCDEVCTPTFVACGLPSIIVVLSAPRRRPSTSSRCGTGWPPSPGTARRLRRPCRTR